VVCGILSVEGPVFRLSFLFILFIKHGPLSFEQFSAYVTIKAAFIIGNNP
jgi:hypothetical protein